MLCVFNHTATNQAPSPPFSTLTHFSSSSTSSSTRFYSLCLSMFHCFILLLFDFFFFFFLFPRSEELRTQKSKYHLMRTQSLKVIPLKPAVGVFIACLLLLLPGISSFLISTLQVHSPAFFENLSQVFPVLAAANTGSCVGPQNKRKWLPCWMQVPVMSAREI